MLRTNRQRRWFFSAKNRYIPGTDPIKSLIRQDYKKINKELVKAKQRIKNPAIKQEIELAQKQYDAGQDTKGMYYDVRTNKYAKVRAQLHDAIIQGLDNDRAISTKPIAIFIGGLPGSGKSSILRKKIKDYDKFIYLSADDIKEQLPEYTGVNSQIVHDESTGILDKAINNFSSKNKSMIIDASLKSTLSAKKRMDKLKKMGYKVILYGTNIKGEVAIKRVTDRFLKTGRYLPPEIVRENAEKTNESVLKLRHNVDKYKIFDTNIKRREEPKLIESSKSLNKDKKESSEMVVDNEEDWRRIGTANSDLSGYDTKKHEKIKVVYG